MSHAHKQRHYLSQIGPFVNVPEQTDVVYINCFIDCLLVYVLGQWDFSDELQPHRSGETHQM